MNILVTGSEGYIASKLIDHLKNDHNITTLSRKDFDLTKSYFLNKFFENKFFDVVFHCAIVGGSRLRPDSYVQMDNNLKMYYNLHQHRDKYNKLITFGSGAEIYASNTPFGISKQIISKSISVTENFFNLIIFALFDENELDSRFIKANIKRYLNKEPMIIHQDKLMDFFYMEDFLNIIDFYLLNNSIPKSINFSYNTKYKLSDIANMINKLCDHKVEIIIENNQLGSQYIGNFDLNKIDIELKGLEFGIKSTFQKIKMFDNF